QLRDPVTDERRFARVKVPPVLPRLLELPRVAGQAIGEHRFVLLDQVIKANLDVLFSGLEVVESHLFRITRDADIAYDDDDADDLVVAHEDMSYCDDAADTLVVGVEEELRRRRFGDPVRLEVERSMPPATRELLRRGRALGEDDTYAAQGIVDITRL